MTPRIKPKRTTTVVNFHTESAFKKGESSEGYKLRKHSELSTKLAQNSKNREEILANNSLKIRRLSCVIYSLIVGTLLFGSIATFGVLDYQNHVYLLWSVLPMLACGGLANRLLTHAELEKMESISRVSKISKYRI